jgi:succinate-semialdehyde dehydrogenase/glutarate-semialdehyde dehydrogenase
MALKWRHAGQACITANRVYVQSGVYQKFADMMVERTTKLKMGHGTNKSTNLGPLTTERGVTKAAQHVQDAQKHGGKVVYGGSQVTDMGGFFFQPTIILDAKERMLITNEESFAPILALYLFETEAEAVVAANNTSVSITCLKIGLMMTID